MLMIPGLFKDTLSSLRPVYTTIMLDSVQFRSSTYDYLETWLCIVTTTDNRTLFQIHFQAKRTFHV